jgi:hypothetical protein
MRKPSSSSPDAFLEIQLSINRLARMARLAEVQLENAVGGLEHSDGRCIEVPETELIDLAIFAVEQTAIMAAELSELHDRLRVEGAERADQMISGRGRQ